MVKDYSKEVADIHQELSNSQAKFNRLLEKVLNERTSLDLEKCTLERQVKDYKQKLTGKDEEIEELKAKFREHKINQLIQERPVPQVDARQNESRDRYRLYRTLKTLQTKLEEETVELSVIVEKIKLRADTHGLTAANQMFDMVCLLLEEVPGWKKNKKGLENFFRDYNKQMLPHFNINGNIEQMAVGSSNTMNNNPKDKE